MGWETPTIGNPFGVQILAIIASACAIIGAIYTFFCG